MNRRLSEKAASVALLFTLCAVFISPAQAQTPARTGWGISAGLGASQVKDVDSGDTFEGNSFAFSLEGEYRFNEYFALGLGTFNLGESTDTFNSVSTDLKVRGLSLFGRAIYPASDTVDVYARIGNANYYADLEPGLSNGLFGDDALALGLGADIGNLDEFAFRIEGQYFNGSRDESGAMATVGFSYRF